MSKNNKNVKEVNKNKKKSGVLKKVLLILLILLIVLIGFIVYKVQKNGGGMQGLLSTIVGHDAEDLKNLDKIQVLVMGLSTDNGGELTDTIILATYDPKTQDASLLSIPRDTFVGKSQATAGGLDKINALYRKSPEKTVEAVNKITGLDVKYYVVIDNQALIKLVDTIGGVEYYVPRDMKYDDPSQDLHINLKEGLQTINGEKAEQLLRFRHGNNGETYSEEDGGSNDLGRMNTQRNFIIETVKQTIQAKNIFKIKEIADIAYEYVETNLSLSSIKDYIPYAININIDGIRSEVLPGIPTRIGPQQLWFFLANEKETKKLVQEMYYTEETNTDDNTNTTENTTNSKTNNTTGNTTTSDKTNTSTNNTGTTISRTEASKIKIEIINGSGSEKALSDVKKKLTAKGYKISKATTTTSTAKTTIINKTGIEKEYEESIKEILGTGNISTSSVSSSNVDVTIILGKDYKSK